MIGNKHFNFLNTQRLSGTKDSSNSRHGIAVGRPPPPPASTPIRHVSAIFGARDGAAAASFCDRCYSLLTSFEQLL